MSSPSPFPFSAFCEGHRDSSAALYGDNASAIGWQHPFSSEQTPTQPAEQNQAAFKDTPSAHADQAVAFSDCHQLETCSNDSLPPPAGFVSTLVVIDPSKPDEFLVPKQRLTYQGQSIVWGPVTLPAYLLPACHRSSQAYLSSTFASETRNCARSLVDEPEDGAFETIPPLLPQAVLHNSFNVPHSDLDSEASLPLSLPLSYAPFGLGYPMDGSVITREDTPVEMQHPQRTTASQPPLPLLKPLSAFNYFYRDERNNIVGSGDASNLPPPVNDFSEAKLNMLLHEHWYKDPLKKRRAHRKSHGLIDFTTYVLL